MDESSDNSSNLGTSEALSYQPQPAMPPQGKASRIGYGICAGICWFGTSLLAFAFIVGMFRGKIKIEDTAVLGVAGGFLLPAIYFTRKAAR